MTAFYIHYTIKQRASQMKKSKRKDVMNITQKLKNMSGVLWMAVMLLFLTGCGSEKISAVLHSVGSKSGHDESICVSADRYAHNTLSEKDQRIYDEILNGIMNMEEKIPLSTTDKSDVEKCYEAVCADHGEIFWVESCSYSEFSVFGRPCAVSFDVTYAYTTGEVDDYRRQMQPVIDSYLEQLSECESDYEKTEVLYRTLIGEVAYDVSAENNQNILSVFLEKKTVCQGYACATQYLLQQAGVPCVIVTGTAQGQLHAWNMVLLDGAYYYLDVTWGNSDFLGEHTGATDRINYGYLNITSEELFLNHQPQVDFPLADCDSIDNNYYVRKKRYFDSWDADAIGREIAGAYEEGRDSVSVKFADEQLLTQAKDYFIDGQHITDYCKGVSQIYYVQDKDLHILNIFF